MTYPLLFILSVVPGLLLMWLFFRADRYEKEPASLVWKTYFLGAAATIPAGAMESLLFRLIKFTPHKMAGAGIGISLILTIVCVGLVEESAKLLAMRRAYSDKEFNEVMDGIVYGAAAAAGFATLENILYVMFSGYTVGIVRALLSVPNHVFYGAITGFYLGLAKFSEGKRYPIILHGLIAASLFHGCYDFFLFTGYPIVMLMVIPLAIYMSITARRHIRTALNMSPFRVVTVKMIKVFVRRKDVSPIYRTHMMKISGWLLINYSVFITISFSLLAIKSADDPKKYGDITLNTFAGFCLAPLVAGIILVVVARLHGEKVVAEEVEQANQSETA